MLIVKCVKPESNEPHTVLHLKQQEKFVGEFRINEVITTWSVKTRWGYNVLLRDAGEERISKRKFQCHLTSEVSRIRAWQIYETFFRGWIFKVCVLYLWDRMLLYLNEGISINLPKISYQIVWVYHKKRAIDHSILY